MAKNPKMTICRNCNTAIAANARQCPACGARNRKPFYKRGWFVILVILAVIGIFSTISRKNAERDEAQEKEISLYAPDDQGEEESAGSGTEEADGSGQTEDGTEQSEDVTSGDTEQSVSAGSSGELIDGMRPEFKEAMDSYEAFYEEYCEFMKEYSENPTDLSLLKQYTELLGKMEEADEKFQAWEDGDMNQAETEYYMEVHMRILQMLSEVSMAD